MIIGATALETLPRVWIAIDPKNRRAIIVIAASGQPTTPLTTVVTAGAIPGFDTGITTAPRVVTHLIVGAAPFGTATDT